jgi:3-methyladenine DNA glycosylase AlkC
MITTLLAHMTPACKDVAALASQSLDRSLPWSTRLKLRLHYWICEACARYRNQLLAVRSALLHAKQQDPHSHDDTPSADAKARLTQAFRAKQK